MWRGVGVAAAVAASGLYFVYQRRPKAKTCSEKPVPPRPKLLGRPRILVTGGMGYIGSHTVVELVQSGYDVTILDNLWNSNEECLRRVNEITGKPEAVEFIKCDMRDRERLRQVFARGPYECVIHFAGLKAVGESKAKPMLYYQNNIVGAAQLFEVMAEAGCKNVIFSSSCTVYGETEPPLSERAPTGSGITNSYAFSKYVIERMLRDLFDADPTWRVCILRYFNPVGAHESGRLGEDPLGIPNCLMPFVLQVLVGRRKELTVFGNDYKTKDGTALRDYIHVVDVARGHVDALRWMEKQPKDKPLHEVFNFGTGKPTSVLELVAGLEKASKKKVPLIIGPRRAGDLTASYCEPGKARDVLGWEAKYSIDKICEDAWRFQERNPYGYSSAPPPEKK